MTVAEFFDLLEPFQTLIAAALGGLIAAWFNLSKINLDRRVFKRELFEKFNRRYDDLNDKLLRLSHWEFETKRQHQAENGKSLEDLWEELFESDPCIKPDEVVVIADYINLCSEEYYWFKHGFVENDVWKCWYGGMMQWYADSFFVRRIVNREMKNNAPYYNKDFLAIWTLKG